MATTKAKKAEIVRIDPFKEMREMMEGWEPFTYGRGLFWPTWPTWPARSLAAMLEEPLVFKGDWIPAMDVVEEDKASVVRMELPGMEPEKVTVRIEGGNLIVEGEREKETVDGGNGAVRRQERRWGKFYRAVSLPEGADPDRVTAEFDKGVLTVTVPRPALKAPKGKKIEIKKAA
jgi:HSP20 family protein